MTQEEILEGNKLIAEFMEYTEHYDQHGIWQRTRYNSSYDWLMPVVEKIQHMEDDLPVRIDFQIHLLGAVELYINHKRVFGMSAFEPGTLINAVYQGVVEFIKWYNTTKTK